MAPPASAETFEAVLRTGAAADGPPTAGVLTEGTVITGVDTGGVVTDGTLTVGAAAVTVGVVTDGVVTRGVVTDGVVPTGVLTEGTVTEGTVAAGTVNWGAATAAAWPGSTAAVPASGEATNTPRAAAAIPTTTPCLVPMAAETPALHQTCVFLQIPPERAGHGVPPLSGPAPRRARR
ncbi:MAG TPA: hypothetical protein VGF68_02530 [Solirubrobacteraceae bacterium]